MDNVTIRPATPSDMPRLIDILYDDPPGDIRAITEDPKKAKQIGALSVRSGFEVVISRTIVAEIDGLPVALMETMRPNEESRVSALSIVKVLAAGLPIIGPSGLIRYFRYQRARNHVQVTRKAGSYYIAELDTHPSYRNRGIGARLLQIAEAEARAAHISQMSLATGISNPSQHLYERAGYRIVETRRHLDYERMTGNPGRVLMVKNLS